MALWPALKVGEVCVCVCVCVQETAVYVAVASRCECMLKNTVDYVFE